MSRTLHAPRAQFALDIARSAFFAVFRQALPADEPEAVRLLAAIGWHFEAALSPGRTVWMVEELQRTFGLNARAADAAAREAWDLWMQARLEDVVLARLSKAQLGMWVRIEGTIPEAGLLLHLSAGSRKMAALALSAAGEANGKPAGWLGVFGRRGLPPTGKGAARRSRLNEREMRGRLEDEDSMPIRWLVDEAALVRHVDHGGLALVAVDDQGFEDRRPATLFGQPIELGALPWTLAARHPVALLFNERLRDKTHRVVLSGAGRRRGVEPATPGPVDREATLSLLEDDVARRPGHYVMTLVERRMRG